MKIRWELYERLKIFSLELYPVWFYLVGCGMVLVGNYWPGIIPLTTSRFEDEEKYLKGMLKFIQSIKDDPEGFQDMWLLEGPINHKYLIQLEEHIKKVQSIPYHQRQLPEY